MERSVRGYVTSKYVVDLKRSDLAKVLKNFLDESDINLLLAGRVEYIPVTVVIDRTYSAHLKVYGARIVLTSFTPSLEVETGKVVDIQFVNVGTPVYKTLSVLGYDLQLCVPLLFQVHGPELRLILPRSKAELREMALRESPTIELNISAINVLLEELANIPDILTKYRDAAFSLTTSDVMLYLMYIGTMKTVPTRFIYDSIKFEQQEIPVLRTQIRDEIFFKKTPILILVARRGERGVLFTQP